MSSISSISTSNSHEDGLRESYSWTEMIDVDSVQICSRDNRIFGLMGDAMELSKYNDMTRNIHNNEFFCLFAVKPWKVWVRQVDLVRIKNRLRGLSEEDYQWFHSSDDPYTLLNNDQRNCLLSVVLVYEIFSHLHIPVWFAELHGLCMKVDHARVKLSGSVPVFLVL